MAQPKVKFVTQAGGLGRLPEGDDHVSGLFIDLAATPAGWTANTLGKKYLSLEEAEQDGIVETAANFTLASYFIREFFRVAGSSELYVVNTDDAGFTAQGILSLSSGRINQVFWYTEVDYTGLAAQVSTAKALADGLAALHAPLVIMLSVKDEAAAVNGTVQPDLRALNSQEVAVLISGDASGKGKEIATSLGINYVPAGGAVLGLLSTALVHENIGWPAKFNLVGGAELLEVQFSDGVNFMDVSAATLETLHDKGYIFLKNHIGLNGTYVQDTFTATAETSDFSTIENNRTIQKAKTLVRNALLPDLLSPLTVNEDGTLSPDTVKYFENKADRPLNTMQNAGELSQRTVYIDPAQNVLSTSVLKINIRLIPRGVARQIEVNIGFALSI